MSYKILISITLSTLLSTAYAIDNSEMPYSTQAVNPATHFLPANDLSNKTSSSDPYQYCFKNSTWIVPSQTLLAYLYDNGSVTPVSDQTVWVISKYNKGYFFGQSYTSIDNNPSSQKYLIGSVTSEGKVYITFYSGTSTNTDLVSGLGTLTVQSSGQCFFIMQMNSGQNGVSGLAHWSYMMPAPPGSADYNNLPGTHMSVPQFLAQF